MLANGVVYGNVAGDRAVRFVTRTYGGVHLLPVGSQGGVTAYALQSNPGVKKTGDPTEGLFS